MPDSERERRLDEIYSAALRQDASRRDEFLRAACGGDAALRQVIESLLGDAGKLGDFLEKPALEATGLGAAGGDERSLVGQTLGPYDVLSLLGAGGMGEVYSARDTRLGRVVALKTLHPDVAADPERKRRLLLEAQAASALNDPRIVALYDVGNADGVDFLVMEYVEGQTLDKLIPPGGIEIKQALAYAVEIAGGLEKAHEAGIVHRDLKPGNIMITAKGAVKVLDFGLAKLTEAAQASASGSAGSVESMAGLILGTAAYMSPEQAQGQPVDARSDIFSFGVMLYEMLTGQRPFRGSDRTSTLAAIAGQEPEALTQVNPDLPAKLERIVNRALEKDRDHRYQSAPEILADLRAAPRKLRSRRRSRLTKRAALAAAALLLVAAAAWFYLRWRQAHRLTDRDTIVLADFTNTTGDSIFDTTLRQALAAQLGQSPVLSLLSDSRIAQNLVLMTKPKDARLTQKLAREVCQRVAGAATIEGSISSQGSQYVVGLRAMNCRSGDLLAEEQVAANNKAQVLRALAEAAAKMRRKLGESLASVTKYGAPWDLTTGSLEALQAWSAGTAAHPRSCDEAIPFYRRAAALDPNFAMAFVELGMCEVDTGQTERGAASLRRAYELRERLHGREKPFVAAFYQMEVTGNLNAAIKELELWAKAYPWDTGGHGNLGWVYGRLGDFQKAVTAYQEAIKVYSKSSNYANLANDYLSLNRLDEARATARKAKEMGSVDANSVLYQIDFLQDDAAGMQSDIAALAGKPGYDSVVISFESDTAAYAGKFDGARDLTRRAVASAERDGKQETAAGYLSWAALRDALVGGLAMARQEAKAGLALSHGRDAEAAAAMALALAGGGREAARLAGNLAERYPEDTLVQTKYLPTIRAGIALGRGNRSGSAAQAIEALAVAAPHELGNTQLANPDGGEPLCAIYLRGEAYLAAHQGPAAATEFGKILDHSGLVGNLVTGALAHLGLGRAYALTGDTVKARTAYQDFLALWKDADPDIPVLKQAKAEYAKLR